MQDYTGVTELPFPRSLPEFQRLFPDEAACASYLERSRWREGFACPKCGERGEPFRFTRRLAVLRCRVCRADTSLTAGTVLHASHLRLDQWFAGAWLADQDATIDDLRAIVPRYASAQEILFACRAIDTGTYHGWPRFRKRLGLMGEAKGPRPSALAVRFRRHTRPGSIPQHRPDLGPCLDWVGSRSGGYGAMTVDRRRRQAHHVAWFLAMGEWPRLWVLHHCDNPRCVTIRHLFLGTPADNTADMMSKGRHVPAPRYGEFASTAKLTRQEVEEIRFFHIPRDGQGDGARGRVRVESYNSSEYLAKKYGVTPGSIRNIAYHRSYR
jgi:Transposase zinc-ribbon domain/HNH endonuclease